MSWGRRTNYTSREVCHVISGCYKMTDEVSTEAIRKQCAFYLPLKKRYCRMQASKGSEYCGEHFDFGRKDRSGEKKRIRCPLDPTQFSPPHAHYVCTRHWSTSI